VGSIPIGCAMLLPADPAPGFLNRDEPVRLRPRAPVNCVWVNGRLPALEAGEWRFESSRADHLGDGCDGSMPVLQTERRGSIPRSPTIMRYQNGVLSFFCLLRRKHMNAQAVQDAGKVRLGGYAPTLAPSHDAGKVRLGGYAPTIAPADKK
jgi:hypothetical protein